MIKKKTFIIDKIFKKSYPVIVSNNHRNELSVLGQFPGYGLPVVRRHSVSF
jgi:hypothetical protein